MVQITNEASNLQKVTVDIFDGENHPTSGSNYKNFKRLKWAIPFGVNDVEIISCE